MKIFIQVLSVFSAAFALVGAEPTRPSLLQIRLVQESAGADTDQMTFTHSTKDEDRKVQEVVHVQKTPVLDLTSVTSAALRKDVITGAPEINVTLNENGRKLFGEITRRNVGKRLAIVVDGKLLSVPRIAEEIPGGSFPISARLPEQELKELAVKINNAAKR
jgi:preprotein translocase subunit SecD